MMNGDTEQDRQQPAQSHRPLAALAVFIGTWDVELVLPTDPSNAVRAQASFAWLEEGAFVLERLLDSRWIIGPDETTGAYCVLYHDARGVSRVYQMSLRDDIWKLWRDAPGFAQRFEGRFGEGATTITARWEKCQDGATWEHDFDLRFAKVE
jgi:hypothetical protein